MLSVVKHVLLPVTGSTVVVNETEYLLDKTISRDFLGMGTQCTWHGSPDCRCDIVDVVNLD